MCPFVFQSAFYSTEHLLDECSALTRFVFKALLKSWVGSGIFIAEAEAKTFQSPGAFITLITVFYIYNHNNKFILIKRKNP